MRGGRVPPHRSGDLERYPARGYAMRGNRIAVVTGRREDLVEVHPPSRGTVDPGGLTVERGPPAPLPAGWWGRHRAAPVPPTSSVSPNPLSPPATRLPADAPPAGTATGGRGPPRHRGFERRSGGIPGPARGPFECRRSPFTLSRIR